MCQGAAVTGQQCDGSGEEVRKCSDQRCPGESEEGKTQSNFKGAERMRVDNYLCGVDDVARYTR